MVQLEKTTREKAVRRAAGMLPELPSTVLLHAYYHRRLRLFTEPKTYTELVMAKKLYDRNPVYGATADKYFVRDYVASRIGSEHLVPLLVATTDPQSIDFESLPRSFVMKASHGSGMKLLVPDKDEIDFEHARRTAAEWLKNDYYKRFRESVYKGASRRVLIEEFIGTDGSPADDYRFYVFNGRVGIIQVETSTYNDHRRDLFRSDWEHLDVGLKFPQADEPPPRPAHAERMAEIAENLAADFTFARVDLYSTESGVYFGEITHSPTAGVQSFRPKSFDMDLGNLWRNGTPLPDKYLSSQ